MTKKEIAEASLKAANWKKINDEAITLAVDELTDLIHCIGQDRLSDLSPIAQELIEKLTKRLKK